MPTDEPNFGQTFQGVTSTNLRELKIESVSIESDGLNSCLGQECRAKNTKEANKDLTKY